MGATKIFGKKKAIRGEIQGEEDPQMLPHPSISIVEDNECIGIYFWWYIARILKINLHNKKHRIGIKRLSTMQR